MKNKVIMVTGATGGIGRVLCECLAQEGTKLAIAARKQEELEALAVHLREQGIDVVSAVADLSDEASVQAFAEKAAAHFGKIDALVNLAGASIPSQLAETPVETFETTVDANIKSTFLMSKHFIPLAAPGARLINVGSMAARRTNGNAPLYCMAKAAVNVLSEGLAIQLKGKDIRVTTLNPGGADTPFWGNRPVKREDLLTPQNVADVILFVLKSDPRIAFHSIDFESFYRL